MSETIAEGPTDRRELLAQQFDEVANAPAPVTDPATPAPAPAGRDASGRFASSTPAPVTEAAPVPVEEVPAWQKPPNSWKKDYHPLWESADPKLREYAYQREQEMREGVLPLQEKARFADSMQAVVEPYLPTIRGLGVDAPTAVKALLEADRMLRSSQPQEKLAYIQKLAQNYGIDLSGAASQPEGSPQADPRYSALAIQMNEIRGQLQADKDAAKAAEDRALQADISKFSAEHEHFDVLKPTMAQLLNSGVATTLADAYAKAMRLDDQLFESSQRSLQDAAAAERRAAADKAAKAARAAAVSVRSSTPGATTATKATDRRSILEEQFSGLSERL